MNRVFILVSDQCSVVESLTLPEISELGAALHYMCLVVPQLRPVVLVVPGSQSHQCPVLHITQTDNLQTVTIKWSQNRVSIIFFCNIALKSVERD